MMHNNNQSGFSLPIIMAFIVAFAIVFVAVGSVITFNLNLVNNNVNSQRALNIAEAGINYYLWHMSHAPTDYRDGNDYPATPHPEKGYGPYTHPYRDATGHIIGEYTLWIKPYQLGSTLVTVQSTGKYHNSSKQRTIEAQMGAPSFANYSVASDGALWFGESEEANGPVHSNQGVRMDGPNNADVTSARKTYVPGTTLGGQYATSVYPGVWCHSSVAGCSTRDKSGWRPNAATETPPATAIDFNTITADLCRIKQETYPEGINNCEADAPSYHTPEDGQVGILGTGYLPKIKDRYNTCSTKKPCYEWRETVSERRGYLIEFNGKTADGKGRYNLYEVSGENDRVTAANNTYRTALTRSLLQADVPFPDNGIIYADANVWVASKDNQPITGRLTIASMRTNSPNKTDITIASPLRYENKDGTTVLGLIASDDVLIAPYAPPISGSFVFDVNASLIAQNGNVRFPQTYKDTTTWIIGWTRPEQVMHFYGSIAVRGTWTWSTSASMGCSAYSRYSIPFSGVQTYMCNDAGTRIVAGIQHTITEYNKNLRYTPPPYFPITSSMDIIYWREVVTRP